MPMPLSVTRARELLGTLTPLKSDCGTLCDHVCCSAKPGEEQSGMLLFPGEEAYYRDLPGYTMAAAAGGTLLICDGHCKREERPLSCRLFPLLPCWKDGEIITVMDRRGRGECPLLRQGKSALDPAFVEAVRQAGAMLFADPAQRAFLMRLAEEQNDLKRLSRLLGAK